MGGLGPAAVPGLASSTWSPRAPAGTKWRHLPGPLSLFVEETMGPDQAVQLVNNNVELICIHQIHSCLQPRPWPSNPNPQAAWTSGQLRGAPCPAGALLSRTPRWGSGPSQAPRSKPTPLCM